MSVALTDELRKETKQLLSKYYVGTDNTCLDGFVNELKNRQSYWDNTDAQNMFAYAKEILKNNGDKNIFNYISNVPEKFFENDGNQTILTSAKPIVIGNQAFMGSSLKSILAAQISTIGLNAFNGCASLTKVFLKPVLQTIDSGAFSNCEALEKVGLPEGLTSIGDNAFTNCKKLKVVQLPSTLKHLGSNVFNNCNEDLQIIISKPLTGVPASEINFYKSHLTPQELDVNQLAQFKLLAKKKYGGGK